MDDLPIASQVTGLEFAVSQIIVKTVRNGFTWCMADGSHDYCGIPFAFECDAIDDGVKYIMKARPDLYGTGELI